ncbi:MAG: type II secretion system F family protein [Solirubrobacteraceae bacterium]
MFLLAMLSLILAGVAVAGLARALTADRVRAEARVAALDAYGYSSPIARAPGADAAAEGTVSGLAARLGGWAARRAGALREAEIRDLLVAAGLYSTSARTILGYRVLAAALLPVAGVLLGHTLLARVGAGAFLAVCGWTLPMTYLRRRVAARAAEIERAVPDLIDQLVVTLEAGIGFSASLQMAADRLSGALGQEMRLTLQEQRMGTALTESLYHLRDRVDSTNLKSFVRAVVQGERLGVAIGHVMRELAVDMRKRRRQMAEEQAQKTPVKLLLPLVFLILPVMFIVVLVPPVLQIVHDIGR